MSAAGALESLARGFRSNPALHDTDGWTREPRREAFAHFEKIGFPGSREETWRHSNLAPLRELPFRAGADAAAETPEEMIGCVGEAHRVVLSSAGLRVEDAAGARGEGLRILPFADLPEDRRARFGALARPDADGFVALNTALFDRGVVIEVEPGVVLDRPVHIVHELVGGENPVAAFPRVLVVAEEGSGASVIEHYRTRGDGPSLTGPVTEIFVGEGARIDHVRLQEESVRSFHVARVLTAQEGGSRFRSWSFALGSRFSRVDIQTRLGGEGAECALEGLFAGRGTQHLDHYTRIDHSSPHTSSRECYKGILDGRARGVFLGHILVRPHAQKIDAGQTSRSVLLSDEARVNMKPWLEIYADDVRCTHGTTVGRLDADALFYLRSRGIAKDDARSILVRAFASEVVGSLPIETLRERMERTIQDWLQGPSGEVVA